jgi:hypothetical protein
MDRIWLKCKKVVDTTYVWEPFNKLVIPPKIEPNFIRNIEYEIMAEPRTLKFHSSGLLNQNALYCHKSALHALKMYHDLGHVQEDPFLIEQVLRDNQTMDDLVQCRRNFIDLHFTNRRLIGLMMLF